MSRELIEFKYDSSLPTPDDISVYSAKFPEFELEVKASRLSVYQACSPCNLIRGVLTIQGTIVRSVGTYEDMTQGEDPFNIQICLHNTNTADRRVFISNAFIVRRYCEVVRGETTEILDFLAASIKYGRDA